MTQEKSFINTQASVNIRAVTTVNFVDDGNGKKSAIASSNIPINSHDITTTRIHDTCAIAGILFDSNRDAVEYSRIIYLLKETTGMMVTNEPNDKEIIIEFNNIITVFKGMMWNYFSITRTITRGEFLEIIKLLEVYDWLSKATSKQVRIVSKAQTDNSFIIESDNLVQAYITLKDLHSMVENNSHGEFLTTLLDLKNHCSHVDASSKGAICKKSDLPSNQISDVKQQKKIKYKKPEIFDADSHSKHDCCHNFKFGPFDKNVHAVLSGNIKVEYEATKPEAKSEKYNLDLNDVKLSIKF